MIRIQFTIAIISFLILLITFELIRKKRLKEEYSLLWLFTGLVILIISIFPRLLDIMSNITGMNYLTAIFAIAFLFLLLIVLYFSTVISQLSERNKELAQRYSFLELRLRRLTKK